MRACVLGQGSIGRRHAGNLRSLGHEVVTYDPLTGGSESAALDGAEVAVVASPSSEHARQARLALECGVPVLVEKPLALDAAAAREIEVLARQTGVPLGVAMNLRFHPGVRALRERVGGVGRVLRAEVHCGSWLPGWRPGTDYRQSYSAQRAQGGGVLLDAIHEIDYLTWLLGPVAAVRATLATVSELELDVEDVALLVCEMASGALATVALDYLDRSYHRGARIVGADATLVWDWVGETVTLGEETRPAPADAGPTYEAELAAFLEAVRAGTAPPVGAAEGRHALEVVDAARASAAADGTRVLI